MPSSHTCNFKYIYNEREKKEKTRGKKKKKKNQENWDANRANTNIFAASLN